MPSELPPPAPPGWGPIPVPVPGPAAGPTGRVPVGPTRLHPLSPLLGELGLVRAWPVLLVAVVNGVRAAAALAIVGAIAVAIAVLRWWRTTFVLDATTLRLDRGVFARSTRIVPGDRIQQVDIVRKLRHQITGTASLQVELAGSGTESRVVLDALHLATATGMQHALEAMRVGRRDAVGAVVHLRPGDPLPPPAAHADAHAHHAAAATPPVETPVIRLAPTLLALGGITGAGLLVLPVAAFWLVEVAGDLRVDPGRVVPDRAPGALGIGVLGALALGAWLAIAAGTELGRQYGYVLSRREGGELRIRRGLLEQRVATVPVTRVQAVAVRANLARRAVGLVSVAAATAAATGEDAGRSRVDVPVLRRREVEVALDAFLPGASGSPRWITHPPAAHRRALVRRVVATVVAGGLAAVALRHPAVAAGAVVAVGLSAVWGRAAGRALGHACDPPGGAVDPPGGADRTADRWTTLHARRGLFAWRWDIVSLAKVQSVRVVSSPFQRRVGLATVVLHLAGGATVEVRDVDPATADRLAGIAWRRGLVTPDRTGAADPTTR